jgi:hypothetical protein
MTAELKNPKVSRKSVWKCEALNGGKGCELTSVGALGSEVVEEEGEVGEVGEDAPLLEVFVEGAGAKEADMEVLVKI